jgi:hypothetical protein
MLDRVAAQDVSQRLALSVMLTKMANLQGGIYTQYQSVPSPGEGLAAGHEILLQNNSLLMLYAAQVGDRQLFDQQLRVIEEHFLQGQIGLLYWKLDDQMQPASSSWGTYSNAPGDSLRVINALLTANDLWAEKSYQELAIKLGEGLKSHSIASDQTLRYYASWTPQLEPAGYGDRTVLAQLDFLAMARLAQQDKSWEGILVTCLEIALSGMTKHGLFNLSCLPEQKQYEKGDGSMIQMAQVAYHLAVYGRSLRDPAATDAAQQFLRFVEAEYGTEGKICSRYDPETGLPLTTWENVAVYALIASVFMELDNYPFAERIISERILPSQQLDDTSPVYGAFTTRSDDAYALDTLEVLLALAGSEGSKTVVEEGRIRAVWYLSFQKDGYLQTNVPSDLRRIRASLCPNYIGLFAIAYQDKKTSSDPHRDPTRTASDESLRRAISQIHRMGMGVVLLTPLFPDDGTWEGAIMPEDVQTWFEHWREILLHYATLAEETGVEVLLLGSELLTLDSQTDEWNKLILAIRSCYHGKLSYGVNFWASRKAYQRVREMNQWRHLDYIGVTGYFELTSKANPSLKELEAAWHHDRNEQDVIADLEKLSNEYGKTIVFWEIGYFSRAGTNTYPWNYPRPSEVDEKEQADCWDAFLKVVRENEWFKGYGIYAEQVGLPANPPGYSVLGKLAEKVLRAACSR